MITLVLGNVDTRIVGEISDEEYYDLRRYLSFRPSGFLFHPLYRKKMWDGWARLIKKNKGGITFPSGLLSLAKEGLTELNIPFCVKDGRTKPQPTLEIELSSNIVLRDYQELIKNHSCNTGRGLIGLATGGGKTATSAALIAELKVKPFLFLVTSIDLLEQTVEAFENFLVQNGKPAKIGRAGNGIVDLQDITVMTVQTAMRALGKKYKKYDSESSDRKENNGVIAKYRKELVHFMTTCQGVICDECITGDSIVLTKNGPQRMDKLKTGQEVQSLSGNSVVWKKITHFYRKGKKKTFKVLLNNNQSIRCTADHLIRTSKGWKPAGSLKQNDQILCSGNMTVADMETELHHSELHAIQNYHLSITLLTLMAKNISQNSGWTELEQSEWHGGFAMMEADQNHQSDFIQKGTRCRKSRSQQAGYHVYTEKFPSTNINIKNTEHSVSEKQQPIELLQKSRNTFQNVWNINFASVNSVEPCGEEEVFDISVEDTHCFFANGMLVHNCQHWRADQCQTVTKTLENAYYRFGASATAFRDEGDDMAIQSCFGKFLCNIKASELIEKGYLVQPTINIVHYKPKFVKGNTYQEIYKECIVEDKKYNALVATTANNYINQGRSVLILVQQINHGESLAKMIPGALFVCGDSPKKERTAALKMLHSRKIKCIVSTSIFDEGVDIRSLDTLLMAGGGKAKTRALQRVGRVLRIFDGKKDAIVIDFSIHVEYLLGHAKEREKIYRTEPLFNIEHIPNKNDPPEVWENLGFSNHKTQKLL